MVVMNPAFVQTTGRVFDEGDETTAVVIAGGNAPTLDTGRVYKVRLEVEETAGNNGTFTAQLQYNHQSGGWTDVTASSSVVKAANCVSIWSGDATTDRISSSAKTFQAGEHDHVDGATGAIAALNNDQTEFEFGVEIIEADVSDTDSLHFRVRNLHADGDPTWTQNIEATVNIPGAGSLPGVVWNAQNGTAAESHGWPGPHMDGNGNLYFTGEPGPLFSGSKPVETMRKSSDGGKTWRAVDQQTIENEGTGQPLRDMESVYVARNRLGPDTAGELWIAVLHNTSGNVDLSMFRTSDHATNADTWNLAAALELPGASRSEEEWVALVERSDGDLVALYGQAISTFDRAAYDVYTGTWAGEAFIDQGTASTHYSGGRASLGNGDRVVMVWFDGTNNNLYAAALETDGTERTTVQVNTNSTTVKNRSTGNPGLMHPIVDVLQYDTAADKHLVIWKDNSDKLWSNTLTWNSGTNTYDAGSTPEQVSTTSVENDFPTDADSLGVNAGMAVDYDTGTVYAMYIDTTNQDVYRNEWSEGGGWGTEVKEHAATGNSDRAMYVHPNVFTHAAGNGGKKVLGWVWVACDTANGVAYTDGQARYDEFEIPSGALTISPALQSQTLTAFAPSFDIEAYPGLADQTLVTFAPTFDIDIQPGLTTQTLTAFDPTLSPGPVQIDPALVDRTVATFAPTFAIAVTPGAASQVLAAFDPAFSRTIDPALVSQLVSPSDPAFTVSVTPGLASQLAAAFDPQLDLGVAPALQSQLLTPFDPALHRTVTPTLESQLLTAYDPSLAVNVTPALQSQLLAAFNPLLDLTLPFTLVTQTLTPYDPSVSLDASTQQLDPALVSQLVTTFDPQLNLGVTPGLVTQTATAFAPTFTLSVTPGLVQQLVAASAPTVTLAVSPIDPGLVQQLTTTFAPSFVLGATSISPALVQQLVSVTDPLVVFEPDHVPSVPQPYRVTQAQFWRVTRGDTRSLTLVDTGAQISHGFDLDDEAASSVFALWILDWDAVNAAMLKQWLLYGTGDIDTLVSQANAQLRDMGYLSPSGGIIKP